MRGKTFLLAASAYVLLSFPLAYVWHLKLFRAFYDRMGYFGDQEPIVVLGFLAILLQGLLLAYAYPFFRTGGAGFAEGLRFAAVFGGFLITTQVVAAAAKRHAPPTAEWFLVESLYLALQLGLVGVVFAILHRRHGEPRHGV